MHLRIFLAGSNCVDAQPSVGASYREPRFPELWL